MTHGGPRAIRVAKTVSAEIFFFSEHPVTGDVGDEFLGAVGVREIEAIAEQEGSLAGFDEGSEFGLGDRVMVRGITCRV